jgi:hypothetical protein
LHLYSRVSVSAIPPEELLKAAKFGVAFFSGCSSDSFFHQCSTLKLLNCVRHYNSGDTDLIYHVIFALQKHRTADFHMIMMQDPAGSKLSTLYCKQYSHAGLADWLQQEDTYGIMARQTLIERYSVIRLETRLVTLVKLLLQQAGQ